MDHENSRNYSLKFINPISVHQLGRKLIATTLLWATCSSAQAFTQVDPAQSSIQNQSTLVAQASSGAGSQAYQQAQTELPEEFYVLYRIVDQIARANGLDERPWRVNVSPEYDINAYATDVNLVVVYAGLFDQLHGDTDAVACVVGHEMAHNALRHIAVSAVERAEIERQLYAEAERQALAEAEDAEDDARGARTGRDILTVVRTTVDGLIGDAVGIGSTVLDRESERRIARAQERIDAIYQAAIAQKEQEWAELSRKQEFEADAIGYEYVATAGFDPQGCLRVMDVLNRLPGTQFDTSHPATPDRIAALRQQFSQQPAATLAAEGRTRLAANPQPLTYDVSRDNASLRINSRHGGGNGWHF